jgi:hypothetical protein
MLTKAGDDAAMRPSVLAATAVAALALQTTVAVADKPVANPTVLMDPVAMPIVVNGQLVNYVFVTIRLGLSANADPIKLRNMEPYFRDALVRVGHRTPFVRADTYTALDDAKLKLALLREAAAIAGPGQVVSAQIIREQAQHYQGLPKPSAAAR